jgi:hypothetical protein
MSGGDLDLLDPCFLVAVDSSEAEEELLDSRLLTRRYFFDLMGWTP